jgi:hypothetical protein
VRCGARGAATPVRVFPSDDEDDDEDDDDDDENARRCAGPALVENAVRPVLHVRSWNSAPTTEPLTRPRAVGTIHYPLVRSTVVRLGLCEVVMSQEYTTRGPHRSRLQFHRRDT